MPFDAVRYLILSDIHANVEALEAVLDAASEEGYDRIVCCGDVVGYGADPNAAVAWVRGHVEDIVRGNHDRACTGLEDLEWFSEPARKSAAWTESVLDPDNALYLRNLPKGPRPVSDFQILHGSPLDEDDYLIQPYEAAQVLGYLDTHVSFFGHTHLQGGFYFKTGRVQRILPPDRDVDSSELTLDPDCFYLVNPGSVGQPRDGDPRAAWALYLPSERLVRYRRTAYDISKAQSKIRAAGLPGILAGRLRSGH